MVDRVGALQATSSPIGIQKEGRGTMCGKEKTEQVVGGL